MDVARAKTTDPDESLEAAPDFSRPIVVDLRDWIFRTAPDLMESNFVWVSTAKRAETREQRLEQTLRALAAGRKWIDRKKV